MPDITISLTANQAQRVAAAIGARLRLVTVVPPEVEGAASTFVPRSATMAEANAYMVSVLKQLVQQEELRATVIPEL